MDQRNIPWKAEWKAAGLDPGALSAEEEALVPSLVAENQAFLAKHPYRPTPRPAVPFQVWALPLVAAAALVLLALPLASSPEPGSGLERMKGGSDAVLTVYRQSSSGTEKLAPGATVRPGDVLQASYRVSQAVQGALVSIDGSRNVTIHLAQNGRSTALVAGAEYPLEFSYELDRAPRFEVFILLVSSHPFDLEPIRQTLKTAPLEPLPPDAFGKDIRFTLLPLVKAASQ